MIPFDQIDSRLDALGVDRAWLAEKSGRKINSIRVALAPNSDPKNRSEMLQRALSEAIEKEEAARRKGADLPDRITLEVSYDEFDAFNEAALAQGQTLKRWAISSLNAAAARSNVLPYEAVPDGKRTPETRNVIMLHGSVAAGGKSSTDVEEVELPVEKKYPANHYAVRVLGQSMEPLIPDGSIIVVKSFLDQGFPRKGTIVVYDDGHGTTLKEFGYSKAGEGDEHARLGKVPVLRSINPDFPDVETIEGGRIVAVFVEIL